MKQPVFFLSHGGGPWPWIDGPFRDGFAWLEASLKALPSQLPERPRAVLAVSGHWEEPGFMVSSAARPGMVFDYSGFPEHTYHISYPAPGEPALAARVRQLAAAAGIAVGDDPGICMYSETDLRGGITASAYRFGADTTPSGFDRIGTKPGKGD